jgi:probable phosphoglycerate mutase
MTVTRVILWRHGNTDWNADGRIQGQTDVPLNERGRAQALASAARLAALKPDLLVTSDLSRAAHTAAALAQLTGLTAERDARLRERSFGQWETLTSAEAKERFPASHARWVAGDSDPGDGLEPLVDLGKRVTEVIRQAAERAPGALTVLATHGGSAKYGVAALLNWPNELLSTIRSLDNCRWTELRLEPRRGWMLGAHNVGA